MATRRRQRANCGPTHYSIGRIPAEFRELYLLDPESLAVLEAHGPLRRGIGQLFGVVCSPRATDAIYVGVDPRRAFDARAEFPTCHLRVGDGPSGGERAVIQMFDPTLHPRQFGGLTIASGDHEFLGVAGEAARRGMRVRVVSWSARLATSLADIADEVVFLDTFLPAGPRAISERVRCWRGVGNLPGDFVEAA